MRMKPEETEEDELIQKIEEVRQELNRGLDEAVLKDKEPQ